MVLFSAPAGYGKTTLVTEWINQIQVETAVCWLSLDEDDSDLKQFFNYLAAAIRPLPDSQSSLLLLLQSPQTLPAKNLMAAFVNDVTPISTPFLLILDDYHAIESAEIDHAMAFLLDNMPPQMTLAITSRADPGFPISRLRARGELIEFRADDLRFTEAEAAQFLQQNMNITLSSDQIAALENRTEGWIAGLQMAVLSMQNRGDVAGFIDSFTGSHRFIMDYLLEEVLNQQSVEVQDFLLQTAVLTHLCADLCDALRQTPPPSQQILEQLETHNIFLIPLDNDRRWYRYHHLFADLLRQRLQQQQPDKVADLNGRASVWYENNGQPIKAIQHALAAKNVERVADLLELAWPTMDRTFQYAAWLGWAKTVPDEIVRTRPVLGISYTWALLNAGDMAAADARLRDVEQRLQQPSPQIIIVDKKQFQSLPVFIASARAYHAQALGDTPGTMKYAQQALDLLPEDDYIKRIPAMMLLGLMYWGQGKLDTAYQSVDDAMSVFQKAGQFIFAIGGTCCLANMRIAQGRLQDAVSVYDQALQLALTQGDPAIPGTADLYLGLAGLHHERGNVEEAQQNLSKSEALGEEALADWPYRLRIAQAQIKQSQGDMAGAITLLDEAETLYFSTPVPNLRPVSALKTRVWIAQGKLTSALSWEHEQGLSVADDLSFLRQFEHITLARLRIAQYKQGGNDHAMLEAMALLNRLLKAAEEGRWLTSMIEILLLQAVAHQAQDNLPLARVPLARALTLAEPEDYVRIFVDEGLLMAQLLSDTAAQGIQPDYTGKLLAAFETAVPQPNANLTLPPISPEHTSIDSLSKRELEILTLIAAGLKSKEIAEQLVISLNTVLYHNKNIYAKLGVNKRTLAIAKAKELNLIES
ncbi:MAG: tetratricopeptide repeat protein [Chloroflexi bacterium]|nr:tetratricopeptide repeat protein [Chloroflexota bacterium]